METKLRKVSLDTLGGGAAKQMFEQELEKVLENIIDPQMATQDARRIQLEVKITPTETQTIGEVEISVSSKLAKMKACTVFHIRAEKGRLSAYEDTYEQLDLDLSENKPDGVESESQESE